MDEKYSDYYIEHPKMDEMKKEDLPEVYHDLWDLCCIFRTKMKDMEEVIRMQAVKNPVALDLANGVKKTVARNDVVNDTLNRASELLQLQNYFMNKERKAAEIAKLEGKAEGKTTGMEEMIITAIKGNAQPDVIESMKKTAGISDTRFIELKKQAQQK